MSNKVALRYSVIQFMPYLETGEFANIGIIVMCPKTGYFDYKITTKYGRVTQFFPNLQAKQYKESVAFFEKELRFIKNTFLNNYFDGEQARSIFDALTRDRETIIRTSDIGVRMVSNEAEALGQLFDYYVAQSFTKNSSESILTERVTRMIQTFELNRPFGLEKIGNEDFHATFPLVQKNDQARPGKIIKPIYFGHDDTNRIYEKSDSWIIRINRLREFGFLNSNTQILFAYESPKIASSSQKKALARVLDDINNNDIQAVDYKDKQSIKSFSI